MIAMMCRTPIQVFRAVQIKVELYPTTKGDIFLFSTFKGYEKIGENIKKLNIFENVYLIDEAEYTYDRFSIFLACFGKSEFKTILSGKKYEELFSFNIYGTFNFLAYNTLIKSNPNLKLNMVEDGPNIYPLIEENTFNIKHIYPKVGIKNPYKKINKWFFSNPEKMLPFGNAPKFKLPIIDRNNTEFTRLINSIFEYKSDEALNSAKIIFMEECYANDGLMEEHLDVELFKEIQNRYKDENCVVKLHPRSKKNRFNKDFKVLNSVGIPWEVYVLNINMEDKILISLSCTTMISSKLLFDEEPYSLLLFPMLQNQIRNAADGEVYLNKARREYIYDQKSIYSDEGRFEIVNTLEEAFKTIDGWLGRRKR